jgi:uncharacterized oligopeptide transporter (OPT) family protein
VAAGIAAGVALQSLLGYLINLAFPMTADLWDRQAVAEAFVELPVAGALLGIVTYFLAAALAAYVGGRVGGSRRAGWIAAGAIVAFALTLAIVYPEPAWAQFGGLLAALLGGLAGGHIAIPRTGPSAGPAEGAANGG